MPHMCHALLIGLCLFLVTPAPASWQSQPDWNMRHYLAKRRRQ